MAEDNLFLLSTRPLENALIEKAAYYNITLHVIPFIQIHTAYSNSFPDLLNRIAATKITVAFTSVHAVEIVVAALPKHKPIPDWEIYCLGGTTFTLVKKYWPYQNIKATAKSAGDLAGKIVNDSPDAVTFFCGNKRLEILPGQLTGAGIKLEECIVYSTEETPVKVERSYNGILFFSPSAVNSYFSINTISADTILFAIGNTTAAAIKQFCNNSIIISEFPGREQLVEKAISYFNNGNILQD